MVRFDSSGFLFLDPEAIVKARVDRQPPWPIIRSSNANIFTISRFRNFGEMPGLQKARKATRRSLAMVDEWVRRGYKNTMQPIMVPPSMTQPLWLGDETFHNSHRSNLLRKDPVFYGKYNWNVEASLPYHWPL